MVRAFEAEKKHLHALVNRARYRDAFSYAKALYRTHRDEPMAQYLYAVMLGDNAEGLTPKESDRNRKASVGLLRPLLCRLKSFDWHTRYRIRNEYYWFSKQHHKQYLLGSEGIRNGFARASYCQGVGAAWHSLALAKAGRMSRARYWAKKSISAWKRFMKLERYYNACVHMGLAYGVLGQTQQMEDALVRGAREAGRPANYHEFTEIRKLVGELSQPNIGLNGRRPARNSNGRRRSASR